MASKSLVETLLNKLPDAVKGPVTQAFRHLFEAGIALGGTEDTKRAGNFKWIRFDAVTSSVANTEITIHHGLGQKPLHCLPFLPLDSSGVQLVRVKVTRPADLQRIYLSSPDTGAALSVLVEV